MRSKDRGYAHTGCLLNAQLIDRNSTVSGLYDASETVDEETVSNK
jgi:hypothetical protein